VANEHGMLAKVRLDELDERLRRRLAQNNRCRH
jgi:hypothetical protein